MIRSCSFLSSSPPPSCSTSHESKAAGLSYTTGCELYNTDEPDPEWKDVVSNFRRLSSKELEVRKLSFILILTLSSKLKGSASLRLDYYLQNSRALLRPEVISRAGRLTVSQGLDLRCRGLDLGGWSPLQMTLLSHLMLTCTMVFFCDAVMHCRR